MMDQSGTVSELPLRRPHLERTNRREAEVIRNVFRSPQGQEALALLKDLFDHPAAYYSDPYLMQFLEGQRTVIDYIEEALANE